MVDKNETQEILDINDNVVADINPNIIDKNKMNIDLFGANVVDIYDSLNHNFIAIMQSFYGEEPPKTPVVGQQWLCSNDKMMYRWYGHNWMSVDIETTFDSYLYIKYAIGDTTEFIIDESVFNFTIDNIVLYNQDLKPIKFIIDTFNSKKIILKEFGVQDLYIMIFHPKDRITNPMRNKHNKILTTSGQTQFDIESFVDGTNINTMSISLNGTLLKNNEFHIINNILTIDGKIYNVRDNDLLEIWKYGGSLQSYYSDLHIKVNSKKEYLRIPKFFKSFIGVELVDLDSKTIINPKSVNEFDDYYEFSFLSDKNITADISIRII